LANSLDADQFDVHVCSLSASVPLASELSERQRRLHVIRKHGKYDVTVIVRAALLLRRLGADLVHSYLFDAEITARLAGRLTGTPVVGSERNSSHRFKRRQRAAYWLTKGCVDLIVANSQSGVAFNSRTLGQPRSLYRVVRNGINANRFCPASPQQREAARRELGFAPDARIIGMFASFKPKKHHAVLLDALTRLSQRWPAARALIVGDAIEFGTPGSEACKRHVQCLVDELGLRQRCLFLGNRSDVARLYSACDVTVLPSAEEGTSNALLESMACGVPVVTTDVSDNTQIIPDGQVGYVVPLGDAGALADRIGELLADDALRLRLGRQARAWVEQEFSTAKLAQEMGAVYREALGSVPVISR
jgi:glycosyltransferase involved in cell wall biosynthesis